MSDFRDIHYKLDQLVEEMKKNESDENGKKVIEEICQLIIQDSMLIICGVNHGDGMVDPNGFYGPDHRFYFHVFSSKLRFDASKYTDPMLVRITELMQVIFTNDEIGGISLDYDPKDGTVLIQKEDILNCLQQIAKNKL